MLHDAGEHIEQRQIVKRNLFAVSELLGRRKTQEDAYLHDKSRLSRKLAHLTEDERKAYMALLLLFMQVSAAGNAAAKDNGTCVCLATGWYRRKQVHVSTTYTGDSVAVLISVDKFGKLKYAIACNPDVHNIDNESEITAIKSGKERIAYAHAEQGKRLAWQVLATRSVGDTEYEQYGVSHAPVTTLVEQEFLSTDQCYMVVTCDGAMEHLARQQKTPHDFAMELGGLFVNALASGKKTTKFLADMVTESAFNAGSEDNITAMVMQIDKQSEPITAAVFDGHGSADIAILCRDNVLNLLEIVCQLYEHLSTKTDAPRRTAQFNAVIQAILTFDNKNNLLPALHALIKETKSQLLNAPELAPSVQWLEKIRDYYLRQLKVLRVVPEDYVLDSEVVKAVASKPAAMYQLSDQEREQKKAVMMLYLYLTRCNLKHCKSLTLIYNKLCQSFGKPGDAIASIINICAAFNAQQRKFGSKIKFPYSRQRSKEEAAMLYIDELMTALTKPEKKLQELDEILQFIKESLGVELTEDLSSKPVARPNE